MSDAESIRDAFDRAADAYDRYTASHHHRAVLAYLVDEVSKSLRPGSRILDVGCGPGALSIPLAERGFRVVAIDVAPRMIERLIRAAEAAGVPIEPVCRDAGDGLADLGPADALISVHGLLGYTADPESLLARMIEPIDRGAHLWLVLPRAATLPQLLKHPIRALKPSITRRPARRDAKLMGESFVMHVWDPAALARRLSHRLDFGPLLALGLVPNAPPAVDRILGRAPILNRLGGSSVLHARKR